MIDEFHLTVTAPRGLAESEYLAIRQTLDNPRFQAALRRAVRTVFRQYLPLLQASVRLSR